MAYTTEHMEAVRAYLRQECESKPYSVLKLSDIELSCIAAIEDLAMSLFSLTGKHQLVELVVEEGLIPAGMDTATLATPVGYVVIRKSKG